MLLVFRTCTIVDRLVDQIRESLGHIVQLGLSVSFYTKNRRDTVKQKSNNLEEIFHEFVVGCSEFNSLLPNQSIMEVKFEIT